MDPVLPGRARHSARTTALITALSLVVVPLLVAPGAVAATDPAPRMQISVEPTATGTTDVVAPAPDQLAVTGTPRVGEQIAVDPAPQLWTPADAGLTFTYRWLADDVQLAGQEDSTLTVPAQAVGRGLSVEITGSAPEGAVDGADSATVVVRAADVVATGAFVTGDLQVTGDARAGQTLTATAGTWTPAVELSYEWRRGEVVVGTGETYTPGPDDVGSTLTVVARGETEGYEPATVSTATSPIASGALQATTPTLSGTAQVGKTLTAVPGAWAPAATFTYRWLRSGTPIGGATAATYTLTAADAGASVAVEVTGQAAGYDPEARTSAAKTVAAGTLTAPTPTLSGTVRVGSTVTAKPGTWTSGTTLAYQWYASGRAISGATRSTYTPTSTVKGTSLTVRLTGTKAGYTTVARNSAGTTVAAGVFSAPAPKISGTVRAGNKVSVSRGTWSPSASTYRYQWRVNGAAISGATGTSYTIPSKYAGKKLTVTVTGSRSGYATRSVTSASATVLRVYSATSTPKISGTVRVGSTLTAIRGTWNPAPSSYRYQWRANGTAIKGATGKSFRLTTEQHGKKISVTVQGIRSGYYPTTRTSGSTAAVAWPVGVSTPKVTGQPQGAYVRTGTTVRFSGTATGGRLHYQWQKRTAETGKWENMSGRTSASTSFTARSQHTLLDIRLRVSNMAGTTYSKAATLYVDSSQADPYASGKWYVGNFWLQSLWDTEAYPDSSIDAWFVGCSLGGYATDVWSDIDIVYVGSDGRTYRDIAAYPYATDDAGCEQIVVEVNGISAPAAKGGVWKVVDLSGASQYGSSIQWVEGLR